MELIHQHLLELAGLAKKEGATFLAYLIEIAATESFNLIQLKKRLGASRQG